MPNVKQEVKHFRVMKLAQCRITQKKWPIHPLLPYIKLSITDY